MNAKTVLILPTESASAAVQRQYPTPYGYVAWSEVEELPVLWRTRGMDARAQIYAAKEMGATQVLSGDVVQAVSPLLEVGDLVIPADAIDQTRLRPATFFVGKGYGFIKLNPPFCPDLMDLCLSTAREAQPRSFRGAVYVGIDGPRTATAAERRMYRQWGVDLIGTALLPEAYLAREFELCYAAVCCVGDGDLLSALRRAALIERKECHCSCGDTMKLARTNGLVGEDWRTW